jgi:hypothetical protein
MLWLALGAGTLVILLTAAREFSRADVKTLKSLARWVVGLGGLVLAVLLFLTGRGAVALGALTLLGPTAWSWWRGNQATPRPRPSAAAPPRGRMAREEALEVLGLPPSASAADIQAAYVRLMRAAHPDQGGSDWLASRINQARDVLLTK